jgi:ABC-2 type transport system ATP-binding protein
MSGLDPLGRREVRDIILGLRTAGKTVFFSSHILQDAEMICDRVAILRAGRIVSAGRLDELVSDEARWFEIAVRGPLPDPIPGEVLSRDGEQALIRVRDVDRLGRFLGAVTAAGGRVLSVWPRRESLEDLFVERVREEARRDARRVS